MEKLSKKELQKEINRLNRINKQLKDRSQVKFLNKLENKNTKLENDLKKSNNKIIEQKNHISKLQSTISKLEKNNDKN